MYNTLNTNLVTSNVVLNNNEPTNSDLNVGDSYTNYALLLNTLTKSPQLTNGTLNPTYLTLNINRSNNSTLLNSTKDITLLINDLDMLNSDNLEILNNFNNTITNNNSDLTFFNVNTYNTDLVSTSLVFNSKLSKTKPNVTTTTPFLNSDRRLLTDMVILTTLIK